MDVETGRKCWPFQPVVDTAAPKVQDAAWPHRNLDYFVLVANRLKPSQPADPATLIRRIYLDLTGLKLSWQQVEAFRKDASPAAYERVVESLVASPEYGQRWAVTSSTWHAMPRTTRRPMPPAIPLVLEKCIDESAHNKPY